MLKPIPGTNLSTISVPIYSDQKGLTAGWHIHQ